MALLATFAALTHLRELAGVALLAAKADMGFLLFAVAAEIGLFAATGLLYATAFRAAGMPAPLPRLFLLGLGAHFLNLVSKTGGFGGMAPFLNEARRLGFPQSRTFIAYLTTVALGYVAYFATLALALVLLYSRGSLTQHEVIAAAVLFASIAVVVAILLFALGRPTRLTALLAGTARAVNAGSRLLRRGSVLSESRARTLAAELCDAVETVRRQPARYIIPLFSALSLEGCGIAVLYAVGRALHAGIGPEQAVAAYALTILFSMIAVTPSGIGVVEASLSLLLISLGMDQPKAVAVTLGYRVFEFWIPFLIGLVAVRLAHPQPNSDAVHARSGTENRATKVAMSLARNRARARTAAALTAIVGALDVVLAMTRFSLSGAAHDLDPRQALEGSHLALLTLGLVLVRSAWSLSQRNRAAWTVALAASFLSTVTHTAESLDLPAMFLTLSLAVVLLLWRRTFGAPADPPAVRRGVAVLAGAAALATTHGMLALLASTREPGQLRGLGQALLTTARLAFLVPAANLDLAGHHESWLTSSLHVLLPASALLALSQLMRPSVSGNEDDPRRHERAMAIVRKHGESSLAFFALLPDKCHFFSASGGSMLAYKLVGTTAVVMGDPIGDPSEFEDLLVAFWEHCDGNGWAFALHQASPRYLALYRSMNLRALKVGEEAVLELDGFSLRGSRMKHLRAAVNRLVREGYRIELLDPPLDDATLRALRAISDEWLAQPGRRERTFTQGQFSEEYVRQCQVMTIRHKAGGIVAFANIIPSFRSRQGNFDLVRYRQEPRGSADVLYVYLALHFQEAGFQAMNLGLAPLAGLDDRGGSVAERLLRLLYSHGEPLFRYRGLREFKDKFNPRWEPRYLVYPSDWQLPGLLLAVARAGEMRSQPHGEAPARLHLQPEPA
ncbi:MAG TPA: flippase-like domain-containing protein [Dehalococcoidia bacterium]|nr:flippase-like domain-containing protein [Dehalococcoidia bacterium]